MNGRGVSLDVKATVPHMVDFCLIWHQFQCGIDLNGGTVMHGGQSAPIQGGRGGEEVGVERAGEERTFLEFYSGVQDVR